MLRIQVFAIVILLLIGCAGRPVAPLSATPGQNISGKEGPAAVETANHPPAPEIPAVRAEKAAPREEIPSPSQQALLSRTQQTPPEASPEKTASLPLKSESLPPEMPSVSVKKPSQNKISAVPRKEGVAIPNAKANREITPLRENRKEFREEEQDIMEEALALLNESHAHWVGGNIEEALEMLDQAYALLLDTNGNPDIARQKDDLRLMISKRILSVYNSLQTTAKGQRGEIPFILNADVEKEIRLFQTVERDFFIPSYQRSALYRPHIVEELRKAGLPEELSWLPLVESGFKIGALSSARALGLWQFIPSTGYKYGLNRDDWVDERMDFEKSTRAAIDYLKELHTMFGDWLTVLAGYNCGEGRVIRTIASQHINYLDRFWDLYRKLPNETARYVPRFLATVLVVRDPQKYGMDLGSLNTPPLSYETVEIHKSVRLQDIARKLEVPEEILNILNAELRHRITPDRPYRLRVPAEKAAQLAAVMDEIPRMEKSFPEFAGGRGAKVRHRVRRGETLASIANKYGTSVQAIRASNKLSAKRRVVEGQRLIIPILTRTAAGSSGQAKKVEETVHYRVQKGDTLSSLARKHGTTVAELRKTNGLTGEALKVGQVLRIGGGAHGEGQARKSGGGGEGKSASGTETAKARKYTVQKGDSLNKIARENNIPLDRLLDLNRLAIQDSIHPGQVIRIQ